MVRHSHLQCILTVQIFQTFSHLTPHVCCNSWVYRGLKSPCHPLSFASWYPWLASQRSHIFTPDVDVYSITTLRQWNPEFILRCLPYKPKTNPDCYSDLSNLRTNCSIRLEQHIVLIEGREHVTVKAVYWLYKHLFCNCCFLWSVLSFVYKSIKIIIKN